MYTHYLFWGLILLGILSGIYAFCVWLKAYNAKKSGKEDFILIGVLFYAGASISTLAFVGAGVTLYMHPMGPHPPPVTLHGGSFQATTTVPGNFIQTSGGDYQIALQNPPGPVIQEQITVTGSDQSGNPVTDSQTITTNWKAEFVYNDGSDNEDPLTFLSAGSNSKGDTGNSIRDVNIYLLGGHKDDGTGGTFKPPVGSGPLQYHVPNCPPHAPSCDKSKRDHPFDIRIYGYKPQNKGFSVSPKRDFYFIPCINGHCDVTVDTVPPMNPATSLW